MIIKQYKINSDGSYGGMEESYSEKDIDISEYDPPKGFTFEVPANETDIWSGEAWVAPSVPTLEELKASKKAEIAEARYNAEIAGITLNGVIIRTDRESQSLITGAALKASMDPTYTCRWKTGAGFITLTAAEIVAVADAVREHVQACFDKEADLAAAIDEAESIATLENIVWT